MSAPGIERPTLLVNKVRVQKNLEKMSQKAKKSKVLFRPHFKTHQSAEIGEMFRPFGVTAITVSSVDMAVFFSRHGWKDITIAFPVNPHQVKSIDALARQVELNLIVESPDAVDVLNRGLKNDVGVWIEVDTGHGRSGVRFDDLEAVRAVARRTSDAESLMLRGLLTHAGQTYSAKSADEIIIMHHDAVNKMNRVRTALAADGFEGLKVSIGDTPSCSLVDHFSEVDEIRPGNFIFNDLQQLGLGSCTARDIAVRVACPVVARRARKKELVIHGGAIHLSKEMMRLDDDKSVFGYLASPEEGGWGRIMYNSYVSSLSQEHGVVKLGDGDLKDIKLGDPVYVVPVHSCLTANQLRDSMIIR